MNKVLSFSICVLLIAGAAYAQLPGTLGVYADAAGTNCNIYDPFPQLITIYIVHSHAVGVQAARFKASVPDCMNGAVLVAEETIWPIKIGLVEDGVLVGYGGCQTGTILVMTITIFGQGLSSDCCEYRILPHPSAATGEIEAEDCDGVWHPISAWLAAINPTPACHCDVPAEDTTWGKVKALYGR